MIIFPAIDIKEGKVVRLRQGDFDRVTEYANDPVASAQRFEKIGAQWLHVVDLDGAKTGQIANLTVILAIAQSVKIPVQMGGGVRNKENISKLLDGGIARVILGTRAIEDRAFFNDAIKQWKDKIAVSLDCNKGMVAQRGWTKTSNVKATDLARELENLGLKCLIYTDIERDGMLSGPNLDGLNNILKATNIPVISSGGVSNINDIKDLLALKNPQLLGVITGRAIYDGELDLKEALELTLKKSS